MHLFKKTFIVAVIIGVILSLVYVFCLDSKKQLSLATQTAASPQVAEIQAIASGSIAPTIPSPLISSFNASLAVNDPGFSNLLRSVIKINAWEVDLEEGTKHTQALIGSGVIINQQGYILTNAHVVNQHTERIMITLSNLEHVKAKKIGWDHWTDLAVIQLDLGELKKKGLSFTYAELGDSAQLKVTDFVFAVGTPHGFTRTVTHGIISNTDRYENPQLLAPDKLTGSFNTWLQTDAAINPGNSGGPLVLPNGKVIGINTWIVSKASNLGFAIPIDVAKPILQKLITSGKIIRSTIGLQLAPLQDLENYFNLEANKGALVSNIDPGSPAEKAGLRPGDVILDINGNFIDGRFPEQLPPILNTIAQLPVGSSVKLTFKRGSDIKRINVTTEELEDRYNEEDCFELWGICLQKINKTFIRENKLTVNNGLRVIGLQTAFPGDEAGIRNNDVIVSANRQPMNSLEDMRKVYAQYEAKPDKVLLEVNRGQSTFYLVLKPQTFQKGF